MRARIAALAAGGLFGVGLGLSGMTSPAKVIGFLDVAGAWDASLAFVMIGAIAIHAVLRRLVLRRTSPVFAGGFDLPTTSSIDRRVVVGSALFGIGWGLAGYCPGPALVSVVTGPGALLFVLAMAAGMALHRATTRDGNADESEGTVPARESSAGRR